MCTIVTLVGIYDNQDTYHHYDITVIVYNNFKLYLRYTNIEHRLGGD